MADTFIHMLQITLKQSYQELPLKHSPKTQDTPAASLYNTMQAIRKLHKKFPPPLIYKLLIFLNQRLCNFASLLFTLLMTLTLIYTLAP